MQSPPPEPLEERALARNGPHMSFHGTAVAMQGKGVLILGPSGSGKSALALAMMALGARLICDDTIWVEGMSLISPDTARPLIEARGVGLLNTGPLVREAELALVVDLSRSEPHRLPPPRYMHLAGQNVPLILGAEHPTLAPVVLQFLAHGKARV